MRRIISTALVAAMLAGPAAAGGIIIDLPYMTFPKTPPKAPQADTVTRDSQAS
ncbi:hypothetical protein OCH239_06735 [Roseivivax halodurans JCM 10272]|uniref:Uncharacterized protein n=1 Tax=Roseivivax halodurans JCM 10272 TaxID=1449350 RepID=X7ECD9_9RHOB|nr:hypothetical protein [Roseivivax halodurans]ETX13759.1 hypothetical protein OCH239_06735 [Roseivivax halodurans JCM 10272]